ncbi:MAG: GDSL-type esterase/lipase family protein, partial [bacterium]
GVSGDTSAGGLRRIDWLLQSPVSVLVLELGANDMLRGLDPDAMRQNLTKIIERTRATNPTAKLLVAGMRAAPNLGSTYIQKFESTYTDLASQYAAQLIPFLLEDVAARPGLNQVDGIHPTAEGHKLI